MTDEIKIGGVAPTNMKDALGRITLVLWGLAGFGKTTLACTAPGKKLLINFDPDGYASVRGRDDVTLLDMSSAAPSIVTQFKSPSVLTGLDKYIQEFDTVIADSLTTVQEKALRYGIDNDPTAKLEKPGYNGWGARGAYTIEFVRNLLELTKKHNKNCIFIAHEAPPETDEKGNTVGYTVSLGGGIPNSVAMKINEFWYMGDDGKGGKRIMIRPARMRKPMKTRMFLTGGEPEFPWVYDADKLEGDGIDNWFARWKANGFEKIALPQGKKDPKTGVWL